MIMKINRSNYELYFMDYLDGNLSDQEIRMLEDFLLINQDLRNELEGTEKIVLSPEKIVFKEKEFLKKQDLSLPVNENNFEDFCIAEAEGDLSSRQQSELIKFTQAHPGSEKIVEFFTRLRLSPDKRIVFPGKGELKKSVIFIPREILIPALSVAAAVSLMLLVYFSNEDVRNNIPGLAADIPSYVMAKPDSVKKQENTSENEIPLTKPETQQAPVIAAFTPKEKKQSTNIKKEEPKEKSNEENKSRDHLPPQRLNPSIQIKLPSVADNMIYTPTIEGNRITYSKLSPKQDSYEYLSLSEYARKQVMEKVFGDKNIKETRLSGWQIADVGISGINKITGANMKLNKRTDEDGSVTAISFNSKLLSFSTTAVK